MKKAIIVIGHSEKSKGARNPNTGLTEWDFNNEIAKGVYARLLGVPGIQPVLVYRTTGYSALPYQINIERGHAILALHCNAYNTKAHGCEMLYYHSSSRSRKFASILQSSVQLVMQNANRGIKAKHSEDRGGHLLVATNAPCVIAEPFFIDNDKELEHALNVKPFLINAYADSIKKFLLG